MSSPSSTGIFGRKKRYSLADSFLQLTNQDTTILQFTDLQYYINPTREDKEGVNIVKTIAERVKPNLVVFTGDIIDTRYCKDYKAFRNAIQPLVERQIPWTYLPGKPKYFPRKELLNLFSLPLCASRGATSFTHTLNIGLSQIHLIDTYGETEHPVTSSSDDILSEHQSDWFMQKPAEGHISLAFYRNSAQKPKLPNQRRETFSYNSGFFSADQDLQSLFTGCDRWNDFVASETEGVWLCYGQVRSGFTQSERATTQTPLKKERWGRVIRYDPSSKLLSTWMENKKGVEHNSIISRRTVAVDNVPLHEE